MNPNKYKMAKKKAKPTKPSKPIKTLTDPVHPDPLKPKPSND